MGIVEIDSLKGLSVQYCNLKISFKIENLSKIVLAN